MFEEERDGYYCPEHRYNPAPGSGFVFCPRCEIEYAEQKEGAMSEDELREGFVAAFGALDGQRVVLQMSAMDAWIVMSQIQLAVRHPMNFGPSAVIAERIARQIQAEVATSPTLAAVAERGWHRVHDVKVEEG